MIKAFSTIEIILSSIIIFLLIIIGFSYYYRNIEYSKYAVFIQNVRYIKIASERFYIDNGRYPRNIIDLFNNPYRDYLPKQLSSSFFYSPWQTEINISSIYRGKLTILLLYLEYSKQRKKLIPIFITEKIKQNLYFTNYYSENKKTYMVFVISYIAR